MRRMGFIEELIPFYSKPGKRRRRRPKYDVERALEVELHENPTCEHHRAANGDLVLMIQRRLHPAEKFLAKFFTLDRRRHIVLDRYGEFLITEGLKPGRKLADVAAMMAAEFDLDPEDAKLGVIQVVKELMLRDFVFVVRR
jgi:hypothetical protein